MYWHSNVFFLHPNEWCYILFVECIITYCCRLMEKIKGILYSCLFQGNASDSLAAVCFMKRLFMRPAGCVALMKILLFGLVVPVVCYGGYLHIAQHHLGLLQTKLGSEAMCLRPWSGQAKLHHPRLCLALPLWCRLLTLLWTCPPAAVWESCCLRASTLGCPHGGVCAFKPKMSPWMRKWWNCLKRKPYAVYLRQFSVFYEHVINWALSKS